MKKIIVLSAIAVALGMFLTAHAVPPQACNGVTVSFQVGPAFVGAYCVTQAQANACKSNF